MRARDNPFRTERILSVRYRLEGATWPALLKRCEELQYRGALVGPHGSGKTTLLEDLDKKLRQQGFATRFLRLDHDHPRFEPGILRRLTLELSSREILLFDGAEQMDPVRWRWFKWRTARAGGLIITVHRPGRLPTLWECRTSPVLLAEIMAQLLGERSSHMPERSRHLFQKYQGNLRDALRECYDLLAHPQARMDGNEMPTLLWHPQPGHRVEAFYPA